MNHIFQHIQGHISGAFRPGLLPTNSGTTALPLLLLIGGQSNSGTDPATGRQDFADFPTYMQTARSNVYFYDIAIAGTGAFAAYVPVITRQMGWIDQMILELSPSRAIYVSKRAVGGTALGTGEGSTPYSRTDFKNRANAAIALMDAAFPGGYDTLILWNQGESDASAPGLAAAYEANLTAWFAEIRSEVVDAPIIFNKLSDYQAADFPYVATVQAAQVAVAALSADNILIDGSKIQVDEVASDYSHYSPHGNINLGNLFASAIRAQLSANAYGVAPALVSAVVPSGATKTIVLTFDDDLSPVLPYWADITLSTGRQVVGASISGAALTLTVSEPYYAATVETIAYTQGSAWRHYIQGQNGRLVANFAATSVTNQSAAATATRATVHAPDWSAGVAGWSPAANTTITGGETIGGRSGVLKMTRTTSAGNAQMTAPTGITAGGPAYKISFDAYVALDQFIASNMYTIQLYNSPTGGNFQLWSGAYFPRMWRDAEWVHFEFTFDAANNTTSRPSLTMQLDLDKSIYLDNFLVERLS